MAPERPESPETLEQPAPSRDPQAVYQKNKDAYLRMQSSSDSFQWRMFADQLEYTQNSIGDQLPAGDQAEFTRMRAYSRYHSVELRYGPFEGNTMETKIAKNIGDKSPNQISSDTYELNAALNLYQDSMEGFERAGLKSSENYQKAQRGIEATNGLLDILKRFTINRVAEELRLREDLPNILQKNLKLKKEDDLTVNVETYATQIEISLLREDGTMSALVVEPHVNSNGQITLAEITTQEGEFNDLSTTKPIIELMEGKNPKYPRKSN